MRVFASRSRQSLESAVRAGWSLAATNVPFTPPAAPSPPDIRGIVPAQTYYIPGYSLLFAIAAALLLLAGWACWYFFWRRRSRPPEPRVPPREIAARKLRELERQLETLPARVFGAEVCDVLRAYIGAQYGLHPERQTSPEFLASIAHASVFSSAEKALLAEFLDQCDLLKFARQDATLDAKRRLLSQANQFLETTSAPREPQVLAAQP